MLEKTEGSIKNGQSRDTDNIGHTRHRTKTNKTQKHNQEILTTLGAQDTGRRQTKHKNTIKRY